MLRSISFDDSNTDGLDGSWAEILHAGTDDGETYTPVDLDSMVNEYENRSDGQKAPVALGRAPSKSNPGADQPLGKIDALRRVGNAVQAKFANIDPRVEQLHKRGTFPKKSIQLNRSSNGVSLKRVGLISPVWQGYLHDDRTPSLDDLMKQKFGNKEHIFHQEDDPMRHVEMMQDWLERGAPSPASEAISHLKEDGYWMDRFDRFGVPALFSEIEHTPLLDKMVSFLEALVERCDPNAQLLTERAQYLARTRGVSFGEALSQVSTYRRPPRPEWKWIED